MQVEAAGKGGATLWCRNPACDAQAARQVCGRLQGGQGQCCAGREEWCGLHASPPRTRDYANARAGGIHVQRESCLATCQVAFWLKKARCCEADALNGWRCQLCPWTVTGNHNQCSCGGPRRQQVQRVVCYRSRRCFLHPHCVQGPGMGSAASCSPFGKSDFTSFCRCPQVLHFASTCLKGSGIGPGVMTQLLEGGLVQDIADFFSLTKASS